MEGHTDTQDLLYSEPVTQDRQIVDDWQSRQGETHGVQAPD